MIKNRTELFNFQHSSSSSFATETKRIFLHLLLQQHSWSFTFAITENHSCSSTFATTFFFIQFCKNNKNNFSPSPFATTFLFIYICSVRKSFLFTCFCRDPAVENCARAAFNRFFRSILTTNKQTTNKQTNKKQTNKKQTNKQEELYPLQHTLR